jgi:hypothetical protein
MSGDFNIRARLDLAPRGHARKAKHSDPQVGYALIRYAITPPRIGRDSISSIARLTSVFSGGIDDADEFRRRALDVVRGPRKGLLFGRALGHSVIYARRARQRQAPGLDQSSTVNANACDAAPRFHAPVAHAAIKVERACVADSPV